MTFFSRYSSMSLRILDKLWTPPPPPRGQLPRPNLYYIRYACLILRIFFQILTFFDQYYSVILDRFKVFWTNSWVFCRYSTVSPRPNVQYISCLFWTNYDDFWPILYFDFEDFGQIMTFFCRYSNVILRIDFEFFWQIMKLLANILV